MSRTWTIGAQTSRAKQKEATRERILKAAFELFDDIGFYATTASAIAKKANVSPGSIYAHFGTPGNILVELHKRFIANREAHLIQLQDAWPEQKTKWDLLRAMVDEVWGTNRAIRVQNLAAYHSWCWICEEEYYVPLTEMYAPIIEQMDLAAKAAQGEGTIPAHVDTRVTIDVLAALFFQCLQDARHGQDRNEAQRAFFDARFFALFGVAQEAQAQGAA